MQCTTIIEEETMHHALTIIEEETIHHANNN